MSIPVNVPGVNRLVEAFTFSSRIHRWPDLQKLASIRPIE
jgi:hypothetical protein